MYYTSKVDYKIKTLDRTIEKLNKTISKQRSQLDRFKIVYSCHVYGCDAIATNLVSYNHTDKVHLFCHHHKESDSRPFIHMDINSDKDSSNISDIESNISD